MMQENNAAAAPKRRNTKEKIIDEAEKLAAIHGIEHLKLQDVADKIGIKLPSVYAHFSGREDILAAMAKRINRAYTQMFVSKPGQSPQQLLQEGAQQLAVFLCENPAYFRLMLRDLSVPIGYDSVNRRYTHTHGNQIPVELLEMQKRVDQLISQLSPQQGQGSHGLNGQLNGENFLSTLMGTLLVKLSWSIKQPPEADSAEENHPRIDTDTVNQQVSQLVLAMLP